MNVLNAIGNINNPELRYMADKTPILNFSFALNSGYGDKKVTTWLNCSLFGKRAETLADMINKGDRVGISGELTNRKYQDKSGADKYSLELRVNDLTLLGSKGDTNTQASDNSASNDDKNHANQQTNTGSGFDDFGDDPF